MANPTANASFVSRFQPSACSPYNIAAMNVSPAPIVLQNHNTPLAHQPELQQLFMDARRAGHPDGGAECEDGCKPRRPRPQVLCCSLFVPRLTCRKTHRNRNALLGPHQPLTARRGDGRATYSTTDISPPGSAAGWWTYSPLGSASAPAPRSPHVHNMR